MIILQTFQGFENFPNIFQTFPGSVRTLQYETEWYNNFMTAFLYTSIPLNNFLRDQACTDKAAKEHYLLIFSTAG